ncbi:glycosyltransferase family 4 protein [Psychromonas sp. Urea-02u-13]|uniref:glycosyltransferase family 4 protein n=1 Tax=Psychromonas sp. Urea-02u-13 TaxID=2058326 RepID=UPI000C34A8C3|nr:glycosyltransferase family 4 protein [Psychromonas sp. Urea-02u-13]PKG38100.1 glycosyltransferase family 1 protein [Psychromonas sp. Urea-02u-13]
MHICHVNLASGLSGGERQTLQLIKQQVKEGYRITVVANPKSPFFDEIKKLPVTLVLASHFTLAHKKSVTDNCDLVHVHEGRAIYWAWLQKALFNIPYIVTRRIDNPLKRKWLAVKAYSSASAVVGLSRAIVAEIQKSYPQITTYKIPSSPVSYLSDTSTVEQLKKRFSGKFKVIHAANLLKHKGHEVGIEAAKLLEKMAPEIQLIFLGDGPQRESLVKQAEGMSNVSFMGKQTNMGDWFTATDLLIHPSHSEGLGSVILEAMVAGLPVIGTNAGGIPDIIDDQQSGLLIEANDAKQLADAILAVYQQPELRKKLIAGGQVKLQQFDIVTTSISYREVYENVINKMIQVRK